MARIKTYALDSEITANDNLLGNDGDNSSIITKRFNIGDLKEFINENQAIPDLVPGGFLPTVSHYELDEDGTVVETSGIKVIEHDRLVGVPVTLLTSDTVINLSLGGNGYATLDFVNYEGEYALNELDGISVTITDTVLPVDDSNTTTGVLGEIVQREGKNFYYDEDGNYIIQVAVTLTKVPTQTIPNLDTVVLASTPVRRSYEFTGDILATNITASGDVSVGGDTSITGDLDVRGDSTMSNLTLDVPGDGLKFGDAGAVINGDALGNLILGGNSVITDAPAVFNDDVSIENGTLTTNDIHVNDGHSLTFLDDGSGNSVTINNGGLTQNIDGTEQSIEAVLANTSFGEVVPQGTLTSIQVGTEQWTVPSSVSQVAQTLPGLSEELSPVPGAVTLLNVRRHAIGIPNATNLVNGSITGVAYATDPGHFAFYNSTGVVSLTNDSIVATEAIAPALTSADVAASNYFVVIDNGTETNVEFGRVNIGDKIRVYREGTENYTVFEVSTKDSISFTPSDTEFGLYLFGVTDLETVGDDFDFNYDDSFDIEAQNEAKAADITTGTYFYGYDRGTYAEWQSAIAAQPVARNIIQGATRYTTDPTAVIPEVVDANLLAAFDGIPTDQRLFFVDSENTPPTVQGEVVAGNAYEVVGYVHDNGDDPQTSTMTFSLLGFGTLVVSTPDISFTNLTPSSSVIDRFLVLGDDELVQFKALEEVGGFTSQVTYASTDPDNELGGTLTSFEFKSGPDCHNIQAGSAVLVDVTGRIPIQQTVIVGDGTFVNLDPWKSYVLGNPTVETNLVLPAEADVEAGDEIVLYNLSDIDSEGQEQTVTALYDVTTPGSERIMRDTDPLELDEIRTLTLVWSGITSEGWIIK